MPWKVESRDIMWWATCFQQFCHKVAKWSIIDCCLFGISFYFLKVENWDYLAIITLAIWLQRKCDIFFFPKIPKKRSLFHIWQGLVQLLACWIWLDILSSVYHYQIGSWTLANNEVKSDGHYVSDFVFN